MAFQTFESLGRAPFLDGHLLRLSLEIAEFARQSIAPRAVPTRATH